jgi:hypothetical protein
LPLMVGPHETLPIDSRLLAEPLALGIMQDIRSHDGGYAGAKDLDIKLRALAGQGDGQVGVGDILAQRVPVSCAAQTSDDLVRLPP